MYDHGLSEGVYAEIFIAAMQSIAYVKSDIKSIISDALSMLPKNSMTAKTIQLVIDCYDSGVSYVEVRNRVIDFNKELGWFQAPQNLGFVITGLLYGEGDYLKSLCCAVNCGDDTDCTSATVGATLGIIYGKSGIPEKLTEQIRNTIVTISTNGLYSFRIPKTSDELTLRVYDLVPSVMKANEVEFLFTEDSTEATDVMSIACNVICKALERNPYSYDVTNYSRLSVRVELDSPRIGILKEKKIALTFMCKPNIYESGKLCMKLLLPDGWTCE